MPERIPTAVPAPLSLPLSKQIFYAIGQLGWSTLINIVNLQLVYFYIPPEGSGIPIFISQIVFLAVLNTLTLIAASGRILDAVTDPFIANLSDRWKGKRGRRIPFLLAGAVPAGLFCFLMFMPWSDTPGGLNIIALIVMQSLFYISLTVYVTPYFALLPELGHSADERLNLSTWISITYALGIVLASQIPVIAAAIMGAFGIGDKVLGLQIAIGLIAAVAVLLMLVPALTIDETTYSSGGSSEIPLMSALRHTFANRQFRYYVVADFAYFSGLTIIMTGLLYYITVLLELPEAMMAILLPLMLIGSFLFYPAVNILAKKVGKKPLVVGAFLAMSVFFMMNFFLGKLPWSNTAQAYMITLSFAVPIAFLGILPNAVLADIAEYDAIDSGISQEGMFFAARTLMQKFGQTMGVFIFAAMTSLGKDPGDDLGIRLTGVIGSLLCLFAGLYFMKYDEKAVLEITERVVKSEK